jgi:hypothetical protein
LAHHRSDHDQQKRAEEHVDAGPLKPWFLAADRRHYVQTRRQPRGRDPEQAELHVPCPRHGIRQDRRQRDAVEAVALDAVVRRDHAHQDLHEDQTADGPDVLYDGALRRRWRRTQQWIVGGDLAERVLFLSRRVPPRHAADTGQQDDDADAGPDDGFAGGPVVDERLVRPIAGVGDRVAGTVRACGPRRPEEERRELPRPRRIGQRAGRNRVLVAAIAEHVGVVLRIGSECPRAFDGNRDP